MNILIVDDHPITGEGYKNAIERVVTSERSNFQLAYDCKEGYEKILEGKASQEIFDLAIIDYGLPSYTEQKLLSGCDLGMFLKKIMPDCKIIMITAHTEVIIVYDIYKRFSPDGLVIKNDITPHNLPNIIDEVMDGGQYLSVTVKNCIKEIWKKDLMVEDFNRQILFYLTKGYKVKELEGVISLAATTIQKRIINMKKAFDVTDDSNLIKEAIKQGFI